MPKFLILSMLLICKFLRDHITKLCADHDGYSISSLFVNSNSIQGKNVRASQLSIFSPPSGTPFYDFSHCLYLVTLSLSTSLWNENIFGIDYLIKNSKSSSELRISNWHVPNLFPVWCRNIRRSGPLKVGLREV